MSESLKLLITVFFGSGASFAILNIVWQWIKDKRERRHFALQIAFQLEAYAIECEKAHSDNEDANNSDGSAGQSISELPRLGPLPSHDAFRLLDPKIVSRLYAFPQECLMAQRAADQIFEFVGQDEAIESVADSTLGMGMEALDIARTIRGKYGLGTRNLKFGEWSVEEYFEDKLQRMKERKAEEETKRRAVVEKPW